MRSGEFQWRYRGRTEESQVDVEGQKTGWHLAMLEHWRKPPCLNPVCPAIGLVFCLCDFFESGGVVNGSSDVKPLTRDQQ